MEKKNFNSNNQDPLNTILQVLGNEFKGPISNLTQLIELIRKGDDSDRDISLDLMDKRVARLKDMLESIDTWFSFRDYDPKEKKRIDFRKLMNSIIERSYNEIDIHINKLPKLDVVEEHFKYVFEELLNNTMRFNNDPLMDLQVKIWMEESPSSIVIYYSDNGIGIRKENLSKALCLFKTLQSKDVLNTLGMGLPNIVQIMKNYNGVFELCPSKDGFLAKMEFANE